MSDFPKTAYENGQLVGTAELDWLELHKAEIEAGIKALERGEDSPVKLLDQGSADLTPATKRDPETMARAFEIFGSPKAFRFFGKTYRARVAAWRWVFLPETFGGATQREIADQLGCSQQAFSRHCAAASRIFKHRNRAQRTHGHAYKQKPK